jgi:hypothetical protein
MAIFYIILIRYDRDIKSIFNAAVKSGEKCRKATPALPEKSAETRYLIRVRGNPADSRELKKGNHKSWKHFAGCDPSEHNSLLHLHLHVGRGASIYPLGPDIKRENTKKRARERRDSGERKWW